MAFQFLLEGIQGKALVLMHGAADGQRPPALEIEAVLSPQPAAAVAPIRLARAYRAQHPLG